MGTYVIKEIVQPDPVPQNTAVLVASGDLRLSANQTCWPAQAAMEKKLVDAFEKEGWVIIRGHPYDPIEKHGFISSQRMGMKVFENIHPD
ncbi:hypothetical protein AMJ86_10555, partial [bacterium SM23_57]